MSVMDVTAVNGVNVASLVPVVVTRLPVIVIAVADELTGVVVPVARVMPDARGTMVAVSTMPTVPTMPAVSAISTAEANADATRLSNSRTSDHQAHYCDTCDCETFHDSIPILEYCFRDRQELPFVWSG